MKKFISIGNFVIASDIVLMVTQGKQNKKSVAILLSVNKDEFLHAEFETEQQAADVVTKVAKQLAGD